MIVFRYDKTFDGLLTVIFDAYSRKTFPEKLLSETEPLPLFARQEHLASTDAGKSDRVWKALNKKAPKEVCSMLIHVWLSELPGSDELLVRYIRKTFDAPCSIADNFTDDDITEVAKIAKKVSRERLYLIQFTRFQKAADDTFFAPVSPVYNALPLTLPHFTDRFAAQNG